MRHFEKLGMEPVNPDDSWEFDPSASCSSVNQFINEKFTCEEVEGVIKTLKSNKACGVDNVRNEFLKCCTQPFLTVTTKFFNVILESATVPSDWAVGLIKPLFKNKGSTSDPDNYRGITLLSCLGKLFTALINSRLAKFLHASGTIGDEQAGFRAGHSTLDHVFTLQNIIDIYLQKRKRVYCAFIDYKKAFDLVNRSCLWKKLLWSGINGPVLNVVHNLYLKAKSCVLLDGQLSQCFSCNIGVRQGENLSPLLFAIYLNDFELFLSRKFNGLEDLSQETRKYLSDDDVEVFLKMYALLYADDTIVMAENEEEMQKALNAAHAYCQEWKLQVNTSKTKIVVFSRGKVRKMPTFKFGNDSINTCDDYIYLGTTFNYNGTFKKAQRKQITQARKAVFVLMKKIEALQLPLDTQCELFDRVILPILLYGSEIWGFEDLSNIEIFHRWFLKYILKLKSRTPNTMVYGETGRTPISVHVKCRMINFWARLATGSPHKLSTMLYKVARSMHYDASNDNNSPWIECIEKTLNDCGMSNVWTLPPSDINVTWLKKAVKLRLADMYKQEWSMQSITTANAQITESTKALIIWKNICFA